MLASTSGPTKREPPKPAQHEPAPEDFEVPEAILQTSDLAALLKYVQRLQEARVGLNESFDSRYEDLVTAGASDKYADLVDRYKLKYAAADASMLALAGRIEAEGSGPCAELVRRVAREYSDVPLQTRLTHPGQRSYENIELHRFLELW